MTPRIPSPRHPIGPFFHRALKSLGSADAAHISSLSTVVIEGSVEDGPGDRLPAWMVEAWVPQVVAAEAAAGSSTPGFRRLMNDERGRFELRVPRPEAGQPAAFITL